MNWQCVCMWGAAGMPVPYVHEEVRGQFFVLYLYVGLRNHTDFGVIQQYVPYRELRNRSCLSAQTG